jgi:hypothetical protein
MGGKFLTERLSECVSFVGGQFVFGVVLDG